MWTEPKEPFAPPFRLRVPRPVVPYEPAVRRERGGRWWLVIAGMAVGMFGTLGFFAWAATPAGMTWPVAARLALVLAVLLGVLATAAVLLAPAAGASPVNYE